MAINPIKDGQAQLKELKELDNKLSNGEEIPKYEVDSLIARLRNTSQLCLVYGSTFPLFKMIGVQSHDRIEKLLKRVQEDLNNPDLFIIENGMIKRVIK